MLAVGLLLFFNRKIIAYIERGEKKKKDYCQMIIAMECFINSKKKDLRFSKSFPINKFIAISTTLP